jgi:hypothetical protein
MNWTTHALWMLDDQFSKSTESKWKPKFLCLFNEEPLSLHVSFLFSNLLQVILSTSSFQMSMFVITYMDNQSNVFVCKKLYVSSVFLSLIIQKV